MRLSSALFALSVFCGAVAACQGSREYSAGYAADTEVNDVTNGLQDNASGEGGGAVMDLNGFGQGTASSRTRPAQQGGQDDLVSAASGTEATNPGAPAGEPARERLLIYRGDVHVEVPRPEEAMAALQAKVAEWGGHLQSQTDHSMVVRIPATHFEEAFQLVRQSGRVLFESRQAQDITEEFLDLGIRIDNARKSRDRLLEVLQKADKVEDILKVEVELRRLTEEIERMEGRRKFLADQVALATLSATFQATAEAPPAPRTRQRSRFGWVNRVGAETMMGDF
jgi:hypothetical protein